MISPNEPIEAEDFINKSEADATPANDEGRVPKLEDDGKVSPFFTKIGDKFVYGEDIDAGEPVFLANDKMFVIQSNLSNSSTPAINATNNYHAQSFTTKATTTKIGKITIVQRTSDSGIDGNMTIRLEETTGGKPNGTVVATTTVTADQGTTQIKMWVATFNVAVDPSTEYAVVFDPSSITGFDGVSDMNLYAGGTGLAGGTYTSSDGSTWGADTGSDLSMIIEEKFTEGRVYLMRNDIAGDGVNYLGIAKDTATAGNTGTIQTDGINTDVTGLTPGQHYFAHATPGTKSTTPGGLCLGLAITATSLKIMHNEFTSGNTDDAYTLTEGGGFTPNQSSSIDGCTPNIAPINGMLILAGIETTITMNLWINNSAYLQDSRFLWRIEAGSEYEILTVPIRAGQMYLFSNDATSNEKNVILPVNN